MDKAIALFGSTLEAELEAVTGNNTGEINRKRGRLMDKWLDVPQRYKSPMAAAKRREGETVEEFVVRGGIT